MRGTARPGMLVAGLIAALVLTTMAAAALEPGAAPRSGGPGVRSPHVPIRIVGDADFTAANGVTGGSGTSSDPYVIGGWEIDAASGDGIRIEGTLASFVVRDVQVINASAGGAAILLERAAHGRVTGAAISNSSNGVWVSASRDIEIDHALFTRVSIGVRVNESDDLRATANRFVFNTYAIDVWHGHGVRIADNSAPTAEECVHVAGASADVTLANNTLHAAASCVTVEASSGIALVSNTITGYGTTPVSPGIGIASSSNVTIERNHVTNGPGIPDWGIGIKVSQAQDVLVSANEVNGSGEGVALGFATNATVTENALTDNWLEGVGIWGSTGVRVYHNDFINNTNQQGVDNGGIENAWDDGYPSGGNFWSNYTGPDNCSGPSQDICPDSDGIGDVPHVLDADSADRYPLMRPWSTERRVRPTIGHFVPVFAGDVPTVNRTASGPSPRVVRIVPPVATPAARSSLALLIPAARWPKG